MKMLFEYDEKEPLIKDVLECLMFMVAEVKEVDVEADLVGKKNAKEQSDNRFNFTTEAIANIQVISAEVIEADTDWADENSLKLFLQEDEEFEFVENSVKMSQDYEEFVNVGEPTDPSLESGHNVKMVMDSGYCPEQLRPGLGCNEPMVLVWTNP